MPVDIDRALSPVDDQICKMTEPAIRPDHVRRHEHDIFALRACVTHAFDPDAAMDVDGGEIVVLALGDFDPFQIDQRRELLKQWIVGQNFPVCRCGEELPSTLDHRRKFRKICFDHQRWQVHPQEGRAMPFSPNCNNDVCCWHRWMFFLFSAVGSDFGGFRFCREQLGWDYFAGCVEVYVERPDGCKWIQDAIIGNV